MKSGERRSCAPILFRAALASPSAGPPRPLIGRAAVAVSAALFARAAGSVQLVLADGSAAGATPSADAGSTLLKTAQNVTHPGQLPVQHGDTVNRTVGYHNAATGDPAAATVTEPITGAGGATMTEKRA